MKKLVLVLTLCTLSHLSIAEDKHRHSAHTHGLAEMTIVYEDNQLMIELHTPAVNMLGFEHEPRNAGQRDRLHALENLVGKSDNLFTIKPACRLTRHESHLPFSSQSQAYQHDEKHNKDGHGQDKTGQKKHHEHGDHDKHDEHDEHDGRDKHGNESHRDIHLVYELNCPVADQLVVEVLLFDAFPGFEKIQVQWVVGQQQGAASLDKNNSTAEFKL